MVTFSPVLDDDPRYAAWLARAEELAAGAARLGEVPVGALVVSAADGEVLGEGHNRRELDADPTGHAEVVALRGAARARGAWRLDGCLLVVSLEPCVMCAGAAMAARVDGIVFGLWDDKAGACGSVWDLTRDPLALHRIPVAGGLGGDEGVLREFFASRR